MKRNKLLMIAGFVFSLLFSHEPYAQTKDVSKDQWLKEMEREELKVNAYVEEQIKNGSKNDSLRQFFLSQNKDEIQEHQEQDAAHRADLYLGQYYRDQYFRSNPQARIVYNPGRVTMDAAEGTTGDTKTMSCKYGDFETATSTLSLASMGYTGYQDMGYTAGNCSYVPATSVAYTNVGFSGPDDFLLTNNVPDPNIPALNQTHNGSVHAVRINSFATCANYGVNMLQKTFSSTTSGKRKMNFSYALVLQNPNGHQVNRSAFFVARVLDNSGNEVGSRICHVANTLTGTVVNLPDACSGQPSATVWRDWTCDFIEFDYKANKTYTIEFFVASCGFSLHFAYAYVDDICVEECCNVPKPTGLKCSPYDRGSILSWDPVPGAAYYKVGRTEYDPLCYSGTPASFLVSYNENVTGTSLTVPASGGTDFSWTVKAVMPNGCESPVSEKKCSCTPPLEPPKNLKCDFTEDFSKLYWDSVPGALYYQVYLEPYSIECCNYTPESGTYPPLEIRQSSQSEIIIPNTFASCFAWRVFAVMSDSTRSPLSEVQCSCIPPPPSPEGLGCNAVDDGSLVYWDPVPGADHYEVYMHAYSSPCCDGTQPSSPYFLEPIYLTTSDTSMVIPTGFAYCFSWWVVAVMPDGAMSDSSAVKCACSLLPPPDGLNCSPLDNNGSFLSWDAIPDAISYKVYVNSNDPECCPESSSSPASIVYSLTDNYKDVPVTVSDCFSWWVTAIYPGGVESVPSEFFCSCNPHYSQQATQNKESTFMVTALPNPASRYIEFIIHSSNNEKITEKVSIFFYDLNGKILLKKDVPKENKLKLDIQSYPAGVYMYEVRDSHNTVLFRDKIMIERP